MYWSSGTVVLGSSKLIRFDRAAPFEPANPFEERLARLDLSRLQAVELYDLAADPGERTNLAAAEPDLAARLGAVIDRRLAGGDGEARAPMPDDPETLERLKALGYLP